MDREMNIDLTQLREHLVQEGHAWVCETIEKYSSEARQLTSQEKNKLRGWYPNRILDVARLHEIFEAENPSFLKQLQEQGIIKFDYRSSMGITFGNLILICNKFLLPANRLWIPTLFHELVHVVQFDLLGLEGFVKYYVDGFLNNGFKYESIPSEISAYDLQNRFSSNPNNYFSVEAEVRRFLNL